MSAVVVTDIKITEFKIDIAFGFETVVLTIKDDHMDLCRGLKCISTSSFLLVTYLNFIRFLSSHVSRERKKRRHNEEKNASSNKTGYIEYNVIETEKVHVQF